MHRPLLLMLMVLAPFASRVRADVFLNEVLGSTTGTDWEFIELYNSGASAVDLTGWSVELWDSDSGASFGLADAASPYVLSGSIAAGGFLLIANDPVESGYGVTADLDFEDDYTVTTGLAIENSSYTIILADAGSLLKDAVFVSDGGAGDAANRAGTAIAATTIGPDGGFLPAGFYRTTDGGTTVDFHDFDAPTSLFGTPGSSNAVPEPSSLVLACVALLGLGLRRRGDSASVELDGHETR